MAEPRTRPARPGASHIDTLFRPLLSSRPFARLAAAGRGEGPAVTLAGLTESAKALFLVLLRRELARPVVVITPDDRSLEEWRRDLSAFSRIVDPDGRLGRVLRFPALDADPYLGLPPHLQVSCERVTTLHRIARGEASFVVAPVRALINPLPTPSAFAARAIHLERGTPVDLDELALRLVEQGYRTVDVVGAAGEWARRGGIVDIFPPSEDAPVRIELAGDEVESLRTFDADSQRSLDPVDALDVLPVGEVVMDAPARQRLAAEVRRRTGARFARGEGAQAELSGGRWLALLRGEEFQGVEGCAGLALSETADLFDHLDCAAPTGGANAPLPEAATVIAFDESDRAGEELDAVYTELSDSREQTGGPLPRPEELFLTPRRIRAGLARAPVCLASLRVGEGQDDVFALCQPSRNYAGRVAEWQADVRQSLDHGRRVVFLLNTPGTLERTRELLDEGEIPYAVLPGGEFPRDDAAGIVFLLQGHLNHGFLLPDTGLMLLAERELFGEEPRPQAKRKRRPGASFVSDFRDLRIGDSVVHVDHGIARYEGLHRMGGAAAHRDFMLLTYEGGDRLFVPIDRLDLVQKYSVPGSGRAKLDKLGGTGWERRRKKVRKAVEDIARDLLHLYARRQAMAGRAFSTDTPWQREFEDAFPYTLTPDQERAIREVKADLEAPRPMERLLCGDVGFGKTEVAMRAAFKVVQDGFQVAVLAPTTVLAFQHLNTFRERFAPFPVKIDMLSRFRAPAEAKAIARRVGVGDVDIIIGTHRLLSKDVSFRKLGLLVVDEEQRFGVTHKERLKKLAQGVDVLSMSATPIPRTLQMSLAGVRDMSVIETPPQNRLAIQTNLIPFKQGIIAAAMRNEMRRDGQIYFVHNRIDTVYAIAAKLQELVPEARIVVGHGQMARAELESVMLKFLRGEYDVLVSTTIIENGLDIPRVNTLIANRADRFGLAQLYQLRGRIGRSDVRAYAYFVIPERGGLSQVARRRLAALQEFSDLGSGFRLAALDLEIRGAGELLGARQHGHISDIGFDLYVQMLERTVREMQGEEVEEAVSVQINLGVDIRLPETYLPEPSLRLAFYKRISTAEDAEELAQIRAELEDRFGTLPATGDNLIRMAALRQDAMKAGIRTVEFAGGKVALQFAEPPRLSTDRLVAYVQATGGATLTPAGVLRVAAPAARDRIEAARGVVVELAGGAP